jgi:VanZ family protein
MRPADRCAKVLVLAAWMGLISYWSGQGSLPIDQPDIATALHGLQHRIAHLIAFGVLGLLARWALDGMPRPGLVAIALVSLFGATDEWHQAFTAGRRAAIDDWATDTGSAALALYAWGRVRTMHWHGRVRALAPLAVSIVFVLAIGLAIAPSVSRPAGLSGTPLRNAAHGALDLARSTRDVARQLRSTVTG